MNYFLDLFAVFGPIVGGLMLGGTGMTVLAVFYRRQLFRRYLDLRSSWRQQRRQLPEGVRPVVRWLLGMTGVLLVLLGIVLMPLPGPGSLVVLAAAALLDLEFGWVVPVLNQVVRRCPKCVMPAALTGGLKRLNELGE